MSDAYLKLITWLLMLALLSFSINQSIQLHQAKYLAAKCAAPAAAKSATDRSVNCNESGECGSVQMVPR